VLHPDHELAQPQPEIPPQAAQSAVPDDDNYINIFEDEVPLGDVPLPLGVPQDEHDQVQIITISDSELNGGDDHGSGDTIVPVAQPMPGPLSITQTCSARSSPRPSAPFRADPGGEMALSRYPVQDRPPQGQPNG
jgi:hypothetical protein